MWCIKVIIRRKKLMFPKWPEILARLWTKATESRSGTGLLKERRKKMTCRKCGSRDIWRVQRRPGLFSDWMQLRNKKPFQCRFCKSEFYVYARREGD